MKTPVVSQEAYALDCAMLQRMIRRIRVDQKRDARQRQDMIAHLHAVMVVFQSEMLLVEPKASEGK